MIRSLGVEQVVPLGSPQISGRQAGAADFASVLQQAVSTVEQSGADANGATEKFLAGSGGDVHSAALAVQRAALQFEYFLQVRSKVVQAYQEIMRMQL